MPFSQIPGQNFSQPSSFTQTSLDKVDLKESADSLQRQRSNKEDEISDHEYYNDVQRELQPLRRSETTV